MNWRDRKAARDAAINAERAEADARDAKLRRALDENKRKFEAFVAAKTREHEEQGFEIEAAFLSGYAPKVERLAKKLVAEPSHADARMLAKGHRDASEGFMSATGCDLGVRPISLALIRLLRPNDCLAFAFPGADCWQFMMAGESLVRPEAALAKAINEDNAAAVRDAFDDLAHAVRTAKGAPPTPEKAPERQAQWEVMQRTLNRARIAEAGAAERAVAAAAAAEAANARPNHGESYNPVTGSRTRWGSMLDGYMPNLRG